MKRLFITAIATLAMTVSANAGTNCYVSGLAGYSVSNTETSVDVGPGALAPGAVPGALVVDGLGSEGGAGGLGLGCDYRARNYLIGAFADYVWHGGNFEVTSAIPGFAGSVAKIDLENQWTLGARAGVYPAEKTLVYALIGWTQVNTSDLSSSVFASTFKIDKFNGLVLGGGMEVEIAPNVLFGAEYRYSRLNDEDVVLIPNVASVNLDPNIHTVFATIKYRFDISK